MTNDVSINFLQWTFYQIQCVCMVRIIIFAGRCCRRPCLFVCLFVGLFVRDVHCNLSISASPIFMTLCADFSILLCRISEVKVKVQGQNRRTETLPLLIARPWLTTSSPNLAIRQKWFWLDIWLSTKLHSLSAFQFTTVLCVLDPQADLWGPSSAGLKVWRLASRRNSA